MDKIMPCYLILLSDTLDQWFGPGVGTIETNLTAQFRNTVSGGTAAVNYDAVSFGSDFAVIMVRGSSTAWEWMTDAQLWAAVALVQVFQFFLPAGEIFNPILHGILYLVTWVETYRLKEIALYAQTTQFVSYLREFGGFNLIQITGQSLGGGISLITVRFMVIDLATFSQTFTH
jgi:hypothetical protein